MSHRDTDTIKWDDQWFQEIEPALKLLWQYLCDKCDQAGVWKENRKLAEFQIGLPIDWKKAEDAFKGRVDRVGDRWVIIKFVQFQYGKVTPTHRMFKKICDCLESHGFRYSIDTLSIEYAKNGEIETEIDYRYSTDSHQTKSDTLKGKGKGKGKGNSLGSAETLSSIQSRHAEFLHAGPPEWVPFDYQSGQQWSRTFTENKELSPDTVIGSATSYREYCVDTGTNGRYVKRPDNWLRDGEYNTDWKKQSIRQKDQSGSSKKPSYREREKTEQPEYDYSNIPRLDADE